MNLEYMKNTGDKGKKMMVAAAFCSVLALMVTGLFDFPWYNYRVFFLFWCILAFSCACIRVASDEMRRHSFTDEVEVDHKAVMDFSI